MITITEMTSDLPEVRNGCVFSLDGEKSATALMPEERSFEEISPNQSQIPWEFLETTAGTRNFYQTGIAGSLNDSGRVAFKYTKQIKAHDGGGTTVPRYIVFALSNQAVVDAWADRIITNGRNNLFSPLYAQSFRFGRAQPSHRLSFPRRRYGNPYVVHVQDQNQYRGRVYFDTAR